MVVSGINAFVALHGRCRGHSGRRVKLQASCDWRTADDIATGAQALMTPLAFASFSRLQHVNFHKLQPATLQRYRNVFKLVSWHCPRRARGDIARKPLSAEASADASAVCGRRTSLRAPIRMTSFRLSPSTSPSRPATARWSNFVTHTLKSNTARAFLTCPLMRPRRALISQCDCLTAGGRRGGDHAFLLDYDSPSPLMARPSVPLLYLT